MKCTGIMTEVALSDEDKKRKLVWREQSSLSLDMTSLANAKTKIEDEIAYYGPDAEIRVMESGDYSRLVIGLYEPENDVEYHRRLAQIEEEVEYRRRQYEQLKKEFENGGQQEKTP